MVNSMLSRRRSIFLVMIGVNMIVMQIVDLTILKQLNQENSLSEAIGSFSISDFALEYDRLYKNAKNDKYETSYNAIKNGFLKAHKDSIKYVGKGSSRAVFIFPDGKCLKIAINSIGAMQNIQEIRNCIDKHNFNCFPKNFNVPGKRHGGFYFTECCAVAKTSNLKKLTGISSFEELMYIMEFAWKLIFNAQKQRKLKALDLEKTPTELFEFIDLAIEKATKQYSKEYVQYLKDTCIPMFKKICTEKTPSFNTLREIMRFWSIYDQSELLYRDFQVAENWGIKLESKKEKLVLIDHGASLDIISAYYQ